MECLNIQGVLEYLVEKWTISNPLQEESDQSSHSPPRRERMKFKIYNSKQEAAQPSNVCAYCVSKDHTAISAQRLQIKGRERKSWHPNACVSPAQVPNTVPPSARAQYYFEIARRDITLIKWKSRNRA